MYRLLEECGPPILEADIIAYEHLIDAPLPEDYRTFMLTYNGGHPIPSMVSVPDFPEDDETAELRLLYEINGDIESCNLDWNYRMMRLRLPAEVIPIGRNSFGDQFCLCVRGWRYGHVFFFDALNNSEARELDDLYWVADSFSAMLDSLQPDGDGDE